MQHYYDWRIIGLNLYLGKILPEWMWSIHPSSVNAIRSTAVQHTELWIGPPKLPSGHQLSVRYWLDHQGCGALWYVCLQIALPYWGTWNMALTPNEQQDYLLLLQQLCEAALRHKGGLMQLRANVSMITCSQWSFSFLDAQSLTSKHRWIGLIHTASKGALCEQCEEEPVSCQNWSRSEHQRNLAQFTLWTWQRPPDE